MELWHHEPQVTTPVLKLFAELVQNRSQRLQFDASSPNGILLFREASKVICSYGNHILNVEVPKDQIYPLKLKGISICFSMLKAALCGSYVNFGVFRLYGDEALDNALNTFVKLLLSIPQSDLLVSAFWFLVPEVEKKRIWNKPLAENYTRGCYTVRLGDNEVSINIPWLISHDRNIIHRVHMSHLHITFLLLFFSFSIGLPEAVGNVLYVTWMSGARSHGLLIHFGT